VSCTLQPDGRVSIRNVVAWRIARRSWWTSKAWGRVSGDVAWGGNWFFLVDAGNRNLELDNVGALLDFSRAIRRALIAQNVTGPHGEEVDHIELFGAPSDASLDSRNFVLCPGSEYDRSPCGTGTSAKLACLAADGKLAEGAPWRQEGIVGSVFEAPIACRRPRRKRKGGVVPPSPVAPGLRRRHAGDGPSDPFCEIGVRATILLEYSGQS
jgi:4-hydroxyproline epimerase